MFKYKDVSNDMLIKILEHQDLVIKDLLNVIESAVTQGFIKAKPIAKTNIKNLH